MTRVTAANPVMTGEIPPLAPLFEGGLGGFNRFSFQLLRYPIL